jgi:heat shock protein HslJ
MPTLPRTAAAFRLGLLGLAGLALAACDTVSDVTGPTYLYENTTWVAEDIGGNGVIDDLQSRITFAEDSRVNGNAGCNTFFGSYQTDGETIRFSPMAATKMMCEVEAVNNQESAFLAALGSAAGVRVEEDIMYLDDADGNTLMRLVMVDAGTE